LLVSMVLQLGA